MAKRESRVKVFWIVIITLVVLGILVFVLPYAFKTTVVSEGAKAAAPKAEAEVPEVLHIKTPESVKALYMTACVAGTPSWRDRLHALISDTELNSVVIDIKDATGVIAFHNEDLQPAVSITSGCKVRDLAEFIEELHEDGVYVIGRISVFQDPHYTKLHPELAVKSASTGGVWQDYKGLAFVDVGAKPYWDYIIDIAEYSYNLGFDELNFDYVRYPSDGNIKDTKFGWTEEVTVVAATATSSTITQSTVRAATKPEMLEKFFAYLNDNLQTYKLLNLKTSVDLFGMVTTVESDMGIGQVLERALPYFDYIAPMVYPSHYPKGWNGFANPAAYPYEVIKIAMGSAVEREEAWRISRGLATTTPTKMRPWLQDFDLGADYDASMIRAQIKATYDVGIGSWMLWSAANTYTESALLPHEVAIE